MSFPSPEISLTQGLKPGLLHCRQTLYQCSHQGTEIEIECTINGLHLKHPKTFPHPCVSKNCLPKKPPRSRKELQVYSTVPDCWLREMLKQGCPKSLPPLHGVLNRPLIALVMERFVSFFKKSLWDKLKT